MKHGIIAFSAFVLLVIVSGAFIAALIKVQMSLAAKIIIASGSIAFLNLCARINIITDLLEKLLCYQRLSFIASEMHRTDPENKTPAWDIMREDLQYENVREEMKQEALGFLRPLFNVGFYLVFVAAVLFVAVLILGFWSDIEALSLNSIGGFFHGD
jgi:hypothetical protein